MLVLRSELLSTTLMRGNLPVMGGTDRSWSVIHEGLNDRMVDTIIMDYAYLRNKASY